MLKEAADFREDSDALAAILEPLDDAAFEQETPVNRWTINDVLVHLHVFNLAADMTLDDGAKFVAFYAEIGRLMKGGANCVPLRTPGCRPRVGAPSSRRGRTPIVARPRTTAMSIPKPASNGQAQT